MIQSSHLAGRFYEEEELELVGKRFQPGSVFLDIGANIGNHTIFATRFLRAGTAIVLEPNPDAIAILLTNLELNRVADRVDTSLLGMGLSDSPARADVKIGNPDNLGGGRLVAGAGEGDIRIERGDTLLAGRPIHFIKIDVEGMELKVLAGLAGVIAQQRPSMFIEVDNATAEGFHNWVNSAGYLITERFKRYK